MSNNSHLLIGIRLWMFVVRVDVSVRPYKALRSLKQIDAQRNSFWFFLVSFSFSCYLLPPLLLPLLPPGVQPLCWLMNWRTRGIKREKYLPCTRIASKSWKESFIFKIFLVFVFSICRLESGDKFHLVISTRALMNPTFCFYVTWSTFERG